MFPSGTSFSVRILLQSVIISFNPQMYAEVFLGLMAVSFRISVMRPILPFQSVFSGRVSAKVKVKLLCFFAKFSNKSL